MKRDTTAVLLFVVAVATMTLTAQEPKQNFGFVTLQPEQSVFTAAAHASGRASSSDAAVAATCGAGGVTVVSPINGASVASPVHFVASATAANTNFIVSMDVLVDGVRVYTVSGAALDANLTIASGTHSAVVEAWDNLGMNYRSTLTISVTGGGSVSFRGCVWNQNGNKYQAVRISPSVPVTGPFDADLYYGSGCNAANKADEFGFGQTLSLGTNSYIFWFSDFANQINMSAIWHFANQQSGCVNYATAPGC